MTQAFNLAQLANNLNTSGQLDATDGLTGLVANANLASSGSPSSSTYLRGDRTWASLPGFGKVLQVVQTVKSDTFQTTSSSYVDITGYSVNITPSSTSSRILILGDLKATNMSTHWTGTQLLRNSTTIYVGTQAGFSGYTSTAYSASYIDGVFGYTGFTFLDSPSTTSAITYKVQIQAIGGGTAAVNRLQHNPYSVNVPSSITVMEIGA